MAKLTKLKTTKLKAFYVWITGEEWGTLVHGETRGKAKARFVRVNPSGMELDFTDLQTRRLSGLDDQPMTYSGAHSAGFDYADGDIPLGESDFVNDCDCEVCTCG